MADLRDSSNSSQKSIVSGTRQETSPVKLYFKQLGALLCKSAITRRVHYVSTFFEIIGPLLLPLFAALLFSKVTHGSDSTIGSATIKDGPQFKGPIIYPPPFHIYFNENDFGSQQYKVYYAPDNEITRKLVSSFTRSNVALFGVDNEQVIRDAIFKAVVNLTSDIDILNLPIIGIFFENISLEKGHLSYSVLKPSTRDFNLITSQKYPIKFNQAPAVESYWQYQRTVQVASYINREYISQICHLFGNADCSRTQKTIGIYRMPYPQYLDPDKEQQFSIFDWMALLTVLSFVLVVPLIVKRITDEKDCKVKELLRMIGMSDLVFWSSHFFSYFVIVLIQSFAFIYIFFGLKSPILNHSSMSLFATFFIMYGIQLVLFAMLITTIFNRPVLAVVVTSILWILLSTLIFQFLVPSVAKGDIEQSNYLRLLTSFLPSGSLIWFLSIMGDFEIKETGLHWSNLNSNHSIYNNFTGLSVMLGILFSCFIYAFLIFYLDNVWPFQYGVPKSPLFLFKPSYWYPSISKVNSVKMPEMDSKIHEPEPENLNSKIQIENVCKAFHVKGTKKFAVNHLWLNIFENQLTVLLGHNGAGKTTTMNMITGMFTSTSGSIFVNRFNVFTQTNQARRSIGLCPQENIYFNELTVAQHLRLFALLKDYPTDKVDQEINYVLDILALKDKKNVLATTLSGGMKRKLALGIALIGDTETLILDEPTSGMDPEARRVIWDLLISMRRKRTILLTTHYMEEADVLADRIAILNDGKLCCSGTPLFLKNAFGTGYRLRIAKLSEFNSRQFEMILKRYIPQAKLVSEVETEVVYGLDAPKSVLFETFPKLFNDIEHNKSKYCIDSCGLSYTTLEDVFLNVGADVNLSVKGKKSCYDSATNGENKALLLSSQKDLISGPSLLLNQLVGLLFKRFHYARHNLPMIILQLLIPAAIIALTMYVDNKIRAAGKLNTLELNTEKIYGENTQAFYYGDPQYFADYEAINRKFYSSKTTQIQPSPQTDVNIWNLQVANVSFTDYIHDHLYGLEVDRGDIFKAWFNNEQYHSLPLSVIALFESLLRSVLPSSLKDQARINVTSIPLNDQSDSENTGFAIIVISWFITCLVFLPIAFPFLAASYILYPIKEQATKSKLIQLMTGLSPIIFWTANFLFDLINHLLATGVLFFVIFLLDNGNGMFGKDDQQSASALFLMILLFGMSTIPVVYAFSYFFSSSPGGYIFITILYLVFGFIANIIFSVLHILNNYVHLDLMTYWLNPVLMIIRIVPIFSLLHGYQKVYLLSAMNAFCRNSNLDQMCSVLTPDMKNMLTGCCPTICGNECYSNENAFNFTSIGAGIELVYLFLSGTLFFLLIILFESRKTQILRLFSIMFFSKLRKSTDNSSQQVMLLSADSDVENERARIEEEVAHPSNITDLLTVSKLSKNFGSFTAVDEVSFGVRHDECFGFLGVNGAGKTTTFSMLTGDLLPSSGNAFVKCGKFSLLDDTQQFQRNIGYCPQFDALLDKLSGEETLYLFARLRGVSQQFLKRDIQNLIQMVGLEQHSEKLTETYSGGNRRKLSIAIALIGSPCLIFLDEPSAGVDPAARRKMWQTLGYIKRNLNSSIVLTSHSMEECEALCSRIAIMVNGKFRCLGSTQHLRNKYGQGYSVAIRLKREHEADTDYLRQIQDQIVKYLPSAIIKDYHQCLLHYHIMDTNETWANVFTQMNKLCQKFEFEDYFVSDTTLEQIFIMFARHQQNDSV